MSEIMNVTVAPFYEVEGPIHATTREDMADCDSASFLGSFVIHPLRDNDGWEYSTRNVDIYLVPSDAKDGRIVMVRHGKHSEYHCMTLERLFESGHVNPMYWVAREVLKSRGRLSWAEHEEDAA